MTFLQFWMGDYPDALKSAERLRRKTYQGEKATATEVIAFNENLMRTFPKPQLYFWMGFLEFEKKQNYSSADQHFERFLSVAETGMELLVEKAKEYLAQTKAEIGY